jgi:hypothetical protein
MQKKKLLNIYSRRRSTKQKSQVFEVDFWYAPHLSLSLMSTHFPAASWVHPEDRLQTQPENWEITGYYRGPPGTTHSDQNAWFRDAFSFEFLYKTRSCFVEPQLFTHAELVKLLFATKVSIERQVIWRAQPFLKKEIELSSNMTAGCLSNQQWQFLLHDFGAGSRDHILSQTMKDHGNRRPEQLHRVTWNKDRLPDLITPSWYLKKWSEGRTRWRACITSLSLVRHSWTENVRIEFTYRTWWMRTVVVESKIVDEWIEV